MLIADAHVHFHACFRRDRFLDAAWSNLSRLVPEECDTFLPVLLLAETPGSDHFLRWQAEIASGRSRDSWTMQGTDEECSVLAVRGDGATLAVVAGRQVPTSERLEVLALGTLGEPTRLRPLPETLASAREVAPVVCIPWGFGKWWGRRGVTVRRVLADRRFPHLYLGDNAGRPRRFPSPRLFRRARSLGIRILPGSDPFPLRRHEARVGSLGFAVPAEVDRHRPMTSLVAALERGASPVSRGCHVGVLDFLRDQIGLRLEGGRGA